MREEIERRKGGGENEGLKEGGGEVLKNLRERGGG